MRLSIYSFNDLIGSYGIIQFEEGEIGSIYKRVLETSIDGLKNLIESVFKEEVRGISRASGKLVYRSREVDMVYVRIELDDNREYSLEIYRESTMVRSNTSLKETLRDIVMLFKTMEPSLKLRRSLTIAFT